MASAAAAVSPAHLSVTAQTPTSRDRASHDRHLASAAWSSLSSSSTARYRTSRTSASTSANRRDRRARSHHPDEVLLDTDDAPPPLPVSSSASSAAPRRTSQHRHQQHLTSRRASDASPTTSPAVAAATSAWPARRPSSRASSEYSPRPRTSPGYHEESGSSAGAASYFTLRPPAASPSGFVSVRSPSAQVGDKGAVYSPPLRSPPTARRPPASRSAHGIATSHGPPPALSTQRSWSYDRWKRARDSSEPTPSPRIEQKEDRPEPEESDRHLTAQALQRLDHTNGTHHDDEEVVEEYDRDESEREIPYPTSRRRRSDDDMDPSAQSLAAPRQAVLGTTRARSNSKRLSARLDANAQGTRADQSQSSQEDLFFDLAQDDDNPTTPKASEERHRPSRISVPAHRYSQSFANVGPDLSLPRSSPLVEIRRRSLQRPIDPPVRSPGIVARANSINRTYATTAHPLESQAPTQRVSSRLMERAPPAIVANAGMGSGRASPDLPSSRRQSIAENFSRPYRASLLSHEMTNGLSFSSPGAARHGDIGRSPTPNTKDDEESVSTTAPSTVWDELDDLKSRIRKLESTGQLPPGTSVAAGVDRPRTATTTNTTNSSSPKRTRGQSVSPNDAAQDGEESSHPLLHSALAKTQPHLSAAAYRSLEACANEALALVKTTSTTQHQSVAQSTLERTMRHKVNGLCRSLTELCITLAEARAPFSPDGSDQHRRMSRPGSRAGTATLRRPDLTIDTDSRFARAQSLDPEPTSARVLSRLEARRNSLASNYLSSRDHSTSRRPSPHRDGGGGNGYDAATPTPSTMAPRRADSTAVPRRRALPDGNDPHATLRPLSRARTDAASRAATASKRMSREYTSQYPMPIPSSPPAAERRSYLNSTTASTMRRVDRAAPTTTTTTALERSERSERNDRRAESRAEDPDDTIMPSTPSTTLGPDPHANATPERQSHRSSRYAPATASSGTRQHAAAEDSTASATLSRAQKRLSGTYGAGSRLSGRFAPPGQSSSNAAGAGSSSRLEGGRIPRPTGD